MLALARELYGPELYKKRVLELNASNERGIDVIRQETTTHTNEQADNGDIIGLCVWLGAASIACSTVSSALQATVLL